MNLSCSPGIGGDLGTACSPPGRSKKQARAKRLSTLPTARFQPLPGRQGASLARLGPANAPPGSQPSQQRSQAAPASSPSSAMPIPLPVRPGLLHTQLWAYSCCRPARAAVAAAAVDAGAGFSSPAHVSPHQSSLAPLSAGLPAGGCVGRLRRRRHRRRQRGRDAAANDAVHGAVSGGARQRGGERPFRGGGRLL